MIFRVVTTGVASSVPWFLGWTSTGVAVGSAAAGIQSTIGAVAAGSSFAWLQSVAATTVLGTPVGAVGAGVVAAGYGAAKLTGYL